MPRFLPLAALASLTLLAACQTLPEVVLTGADTFDVRYDPHKTSEPEADARAAALCQDQPQFVTSATRFDGFTYRSYRCHRKP